MTPNLQFHCNIHFALRGLIDDDLQYVFYQYDRKNQSNFVFFPVSLRQECNARNISSTGTWINFHPVLDQHSRATIKLASVLFLQKFPCDVARWIWHEKD